MIQPITVGINFKHVVKIKQYFFIQEKTIKKMAKLFDVDNFVINAPGVKIIKLINYFSIIIISIYFDLYHLSTLLILVELSSVIMAKFVVVIESFDSIIEIAVSLDVKELIKMFTIMINLFAFKTVVIAEFRLFSGLFEIKKDYMKLEMLHINYFGMS